MTDKTKVVPVEPTEAMFDDFWHAWPTQSDQSGERYPEDIQIVGFKGWAACYRAMLSAAPPASVVDREAIEDTLRNAYSNGVRDALTHKERPAAYFTETTDAILALIPAPSNEGLVEAADRVMAAENIWNLEQDERAFKVLSDALDGLRQALSSYREGK